MNAKHSTYIQATSGDILDVTIQSRMNKNGYIDYTFPSLFVCETTLNGTKIDVTGATYTWTITNSLGNNLDLSTATQVLNSIRLEPGSFAPQDQYTVKVDVTFDSKSGSTTVMYTTEFDTLYQLKVQPTSGVALSTEFVVTVVSQSFSYEINNFLFGYILNGTKYYLTRESPNPLHNVILPEGDPTTGKLDLFVEVRNEMGKVYYLSTQVVSSAPTILASNFNSMVEHMNSQGVEDSIKIRLKYQHLRSSLSTSYKLKAANLMLDGLLKDGDKKKENQDDPTRLTIAQTLETISADFQTLGNSDLMIRTVDIFYQTIVNENTEKNTSGYVLEVSEQSLQSFFHYVDNVFTHIEIITYASQEGVKTKLQHAIDIALRGSLTNEPAGNPAVVKQGTSLSITSAKINMNGFVTNTTKSFTTPDGLNSSITIPKTFSASNAEYLQFTSIMTKEPVYHTKGINAGSSLKTGMYRLKFEETEASIGIGNDKVRNNELIITNLTDPIEIEIPFSEPVRENMTLSCVYSTKSGDIISSEGITTICSSSSCKCRTTHLTDFMLEEHTDTTQRESSSQGIPETVLKLGVHKSFAFWVSLFLILILGPLIFVAIIKDRRDIEKYGIGGNPHLRKYVLF